MTKFKIISAAVILSVMSAGPVLAQAAVQEPGAYAFYHPDGDVLEANRPWPRGPSGGMASVPFGNGSYAYMNTSPNSSACAQRYRSYDPASRTYLGYDGNRHSCR
jgi:ABC-type glycerol-3-phosphate transport system substrate-binding protein